ncbi:MAG: cysteine--tRNA ligase [Candidatus Makana argininalis]
MLKIFNTKTKKKEIFTPLNNNIVNIYVCGVTVYDACHIGHGRTFLIFDIIIRYLIYKGYKVNYIRNITDIEDKIILKSIKYKKSFKIISNNMINQMKKDFDKLKIIRPNYEPKVTDYINLIIKFIKKLLNKKNAYISKNGDVIFSIKTYKKYGKLSKQNLLKLNSKHKNLNNFFKKNYLDFVLWKICNKKEPGWISPWGYGRPGWHIECSSIKLFLKYNFDINGGGSDLIFPHHENEITQYNCICNKKNIGTWIHTGILITNKKKMSKSKGNFSYIKDIIKKYNYEIIRYFLISNHYRSKFYYTEENIKQYSTSLKNLYFSLKDTNTNLSNNLCKKYILQFNKAMDNDFNIPSAYSILFKISNKINKLKKNNSKHVHKMASTLKMLGNILGLLEQDPDNFLKNKNNKKYNKCYILKLIKERNLARKNKKWFISDKIRNKLYDIGVILEDEKEKTNWYIF